MGGWVRINKDTIKWDGNFFANNVPSTGAVASDALWTRTAAGLSPTVITDKVGIGRVPTGSYSLDMSGSYNIPLNMLTSTNQTYIRMQNTDGIVQFGNYLGNAFFQGGSGKAIQFWTTGIKMTISNNGNVGIGMIASSALLQVAGTASAAIMTCASMGIGTSSPSDTLHIVDTRTDNENAALFIQHSGVTPAGAAYGLVIEKTGASKTNVGGSFSASGGDNNYGLIVPAGKVGIGTETPATKLDVRGVASMAGLSVGAVASCATLSSDNITINLATLPTSDPAASGALWRSGADLKISL